MTHAALYVALTLAGIIMWIVALLRRSPKGTPC